MRRSLGIGLLALLYLLMPLSAQSGGGKKEFGLAVGQKLPFHVVDFAFGPHKGGGCPSVMISNARTRGIVLWALTPDDKFFELAKRLQVPLAKYPKAEGYLVVFERQGDLAEQAKKNGLEKFTVG